MKKIIIANWKMNPRNEKEAVALAEKIDASNVVIAPPFIFLKAVGKSIKRASLGAQDVFWENPPAGGGAYTGEVSPNQLKILGVKYVIIGHSERRRWLGESDKMVNKKVKAAVAAGLKIILCVGESRDVRKKGLKAAKNFVKNQLVKDLKGNGKLEIRNLLIAYEPIWAIGTGKADKPKETVEMAKFIKSFLDSKFKIQNSKLLYGGSVTAKNTKAFLSQKEIDGALVGGASLKAKEFRKIIEININS